MSLQLSATSPAGVYTDTQGRVKPCHCSHRQLHQQKPQGLELQRKVEMSCRIPMHYAESVARFLLITNYDYLQSYFHRIGSASDGICPLFRIADTAITC
ncbi:hypothetical protein CDAR_66261 [Caerostris darwini]|uniref:Uncharacterized protein n=1 Tax=Caerostris darwini TaxID=1538125 RepID=A0AAV4VUF1_9ARAC|nr:hypothetical protein CDAR_66261 [Caerostris darwini]